MALCTLPWRRTQSATYLEIYVVLVKLKFGVVWVHFAHLSICTDNTYQVVDSPCHFLTSYDRPIDRPYDG